MAILKNSHIYLWLLREVKSKGNFKEIRQNRGSSARLFISRQNRGSSARLFIRIDIKSHNSLEDYIKELMKGYDEKNMSIEQEF
ncbi:hypothetical protein MSMAW_1863 [Methanosarcina mazei WWM610]|jgi:hypothetical protein|uniref:Uncharacterized protein n=5 Tax=Methanosarcina mazei TaxID=2209 RepID=A0A0F8K628_METMZ|nr:hypothetical protein MmTuc01_2825 [Methanosarcina mazei Tuc01]AKB40854.1 hypothetical protein MSMAW_1863 [Methanosarcina mazei WWM610]AKB68517.1 hypothetical protein MSMAL_1974 [Methanosarcina mazei LYC]AKB71064.1 hypothetical protein MSMAC_1174 [Methanosarcina mazei C16]KKG12672.1 hypothetical protein DU34_20305 [Methanosarcina mazei]